MCVLCVEEGGGSGSEHMRACGNDAVLSVGVSVCRICLAFSFFYEGNIQINLTLPRGLLWKGFHRSSSISARSSHLCKHADTHTHTHTHIHTYTHITACWRTHCPCLSLHNHFSSLGRNTHALYA